MAACFRRFGAWRLAVFMSFRSPRRGAALGATTIVVEQVTVNFWGYRNPYTYYIIPMVDV